MEEGEVADRIFFALLLQGLRYEEVAFEHAILCVWKNITSSLVCVV